MNVRPYVTVRGLIKLYTYNGGKVYLFPAKISASKLTKLLIFPFDMRSDILRYQLNYRHDKTRYHGHFQVKKCSRAIN